MIDKIDIDKLDRYFNNWCTIKTILNYKIKTIKYIFYDKVFNERSTIFGKEHFGKDYEIIITKDILLMNSKMSEKLNY